MMPEPGRDDRFPRSRAIAERARRVVWKGGSEATQHPSLIEAGFPRYLARGEGARVWDADGNAYLDYLMSWGSVLLGHRAPAVEAAVRRQLEEGALFNLAVEGEVALAERLVRHVPAAELVRFVASGSEATAAAASASRSMESAPSKASSVSGYSWPMSPRPPALNRASVTAWATASASL